MSRVTTTRDHRSDVEQDRAWASQALFGSARGMPWWAAVLIAFVVSLLTAFINRAPNGELGWIFKGGYFLSCVVAVCLVQRRSLFGPMVQPPLIAVIVVPTVALMTANTPPNGGMTARLLTVAQPLVTSFPTMAVTTAATVILGVVRIFLQKRPAPAAQPKPARPARPQSRDEDEPVRRPARPAEDDRRGGRPPAPRPQGGGRPGPREQAPREQPPRGGGGGRGGAAGDARGGSGARGGAGAGGAGAGAGGAGGGRGGGRPVPPRGGQPGGRAQPPPPQRGGPAPRGGGQPPAPRRHPPREDDYY